MKYMLLTYLNEKTWFALTPEQQKEQMGSCAHIFDELRAKKKFLGGAPLNATSTATTVRYRDGKRVLTDGPFAETREQLGGYTIIEAENLDEAIAIASGIVGTQTLLASIEVRPIVELKDMPAGH
jgi:hypothetical protein